MGLHEIKGRLSAPATIGAVLWAVLSASDSEAGSQTPAVGAIEGRVRLGAGASTSLLRVENPTDPEICGPSRDVVDLQVSPGGGVADVLVWLEGAALEASRPLQPRRRVLDNVGCEFSPRALVLEAGAPFELANTDSTLHTVHWRGPTEENVALPLHEVRVERRLTEVGLYRIRCDVHPWMRAWARVDSHSFHAVSGLDGGFVIDGLPLGRHTLVAWHERLGSSTVEVEVSASGPTRVSLSLGGG